ncbi:TonB family protein [Methylosinus sp. Sm6]|uniref:TonB family protein n=1 Tax=Methylosinus sp. Sm6 TaxID=2866948 RepID=UPI001C991635|nr:TonB family protein [Methylosinus sp. Sm6]MBY6241942.1 TonB family protein [Methylosinus sp. Sm6]
MSVAALWGASGGDRRVWSVAGVAALALHVTAIGAALFVAAAEPEDDADGAPAIEISLAPAAPHVEDSPDAPPGPPAEEAAAAAPAVASSQTKDSDDPKIARTEAEDADYTHAEKHEKPVEEPTKHEATPVVSAESAASVAAAPPKLDAMQEAPRAAAPALGATDKAIRAAKLDWTKRVSAHVRANLQYPRGAPKLDVVVQIDFTLDRLGHLVEAHVGKSSGVAVFDAAALATLKRADPLPPPPPATADERLSFTIPVKFGLSGGR